MTASPEPISWRRAGLREEEPGNVPVIRDDRRNTGGRGDLLAAPRTRLTGSAEPPQRRRQRNRVLRSSRAAGPRQAAGAGPSATKGAPGRASTSSPRGNLYTTRHKAGGG